MAGEKGGAMKAVVGIIVTLLVLIIAFVALIKFDVAGLGTKVIGPSLVNVPVINMILPEMPVEEGVGDSAVDYNFETIEEAVEILKITEKMLMESGLEAEIINEQLTQLNAEVERLKIFEKNQLQFETDKAEFDTLVTQSAEPIEYKNWFEKINPDNAEAIYSEVIGEVQYSEDLQGVVDIYQNMKPALAAERLEDMSTTKLDQVATIIKALSSDQAAEILGLMESAAAVKITSYIYPDK